MGETVQVAAARKRQRQRFSASTERGSAIKSAFEEPCNKVCDCCNRSCYKEGVTNTGDPVSCMAARCVPMCLAGIICMQPFMISNPLPLSI